MLEQIKQQAFEFCLVLFELFNWIIFKFSGKDTCSPYESSASIYKIWMRYKPPQNLDFSDKFDFLCTYAGSTHPSDLLENNFSLYYITATEAVFVDCGNMNIFDSKYHAFVYNAQFRHASRMVIVPIESFHLIAKQIDLPTVPILHVANHGRCGSTLLSKVFEAISNSFSVSEMNAFTSIAEMSRKGLCDRSTLKQMCLSSIMFMLKHANAYKSKIVFFKCQNTVTYITDIMIDAVPSVKHIYMYRQPIAFIRSYEKLFAINKWPKPTVKECKFWAGIGHNELLQGTTVHPCMLSELHFVSKIGLYWITGIASFNNLLRKGYTIKSLKFEDFVAEPRKVILSLFAYADIPEDFLPDLDTVLTKDSQSGTEYSSRKFKEKDLKACYTEFTDPIKSVIDGLCNHFDVPCFWDDITLPHKIC